MNITTARKWNVFEGPAFVGTFTGTAPNQARDAALLEMGFSLATIRDSSNWVPVLRLVELK